MESNKQMHIKNIHYGMVQETNASVYVFYICMCIHSIGTDVGRCSSISALKKIM